MANEQPKMPKDDAKPTATDRKGQTGELTDDELKKVDGGAIDAFMQIGGTGGETGKD